jgi:hypothetical protein
MIPRHWIRGQFIEPPAQRQFRLPGLAAAHDRSLHALFRLGIAHTLAEQIGVTAKLLDGRERDGIDPRLDNDTAATGNPAIR